MPDANNAQQQPPTATDMATTLVEALVAIGDKLEMSSLRISKAIDRLTMALRIGIESTRGTYGGLITGKSAQTTPANETQTKSQHAFDNE